MLQLPARSGAALSACVLLLLAACGGGSSESPGTEASSSAAAGGEQRKRALAVPPSVTIPADANVKGVFGPVLNWPVIPVHAVLTPDGRVLSYGTDTTGRQTGSFQYGVWDPVDGSHLTLNNATGTDIFCSSQLVLPGTSTVFIAGGDNWTGTATTNTGNNNSNLFDASARTLTRSGNMNRARWYSSSTTLLNGETYIQGGSGGTDRPEVRQANGTFRLLTGADTSTLSFDYPRNFIAPDGRVFGFDTAGRMYWVNPAGTGSITMAGQFTSAVAGSDSSAAMFRPGRILQFGGNSTGAIVIDITSGTPVVSNTSALARQRRLGTATILADGRVLASGGSSVYNELTNVAYDTEIWNPTTGTWTLAARNVRARLYHSIGLLLPDATVLVAGGGAPGPQANLNGEIFYPPYLFAANGVEAPRPTITTAPTVVDPGRTMQLGIGSARPISRVTLVKTGSVTHAFNMEQRFVDAPFSVSGSTVSVQIPARASDVPPGTWMVFVFDDAGVPSVAKMLRINVAPALNTAVQPVITTPPAQSGTVGTAASLQISASDPNGDVLRYSASGLPPGLAIDPATGRIAGTPTTTGSYSVTVAVSDGINASSASFAWTISAGSGTLVLPMPPAPAPAAVGAAATFTASASGIGVQYSWDFGDGSPATPWSASGSASQVFANPGIYYVTVTARDSAGNTQRQTVLHQAYLNLTAAAPAVSSQMLLEPRANANPRLWVINPDANTVSVFDAVTRAKAGEVTVGLAPRALALAPDGSVWVTNRQAASIAVINPATLTVSRTIGLPRASQPHGIAFARANGSALVALEATGQLAKVSASTFAITGTVAVGANPRHVTVAADGSTAWVSRFISPPLPGEGTTSVQTTSGGLPVGGELRVVDSNTMAVQRIVPLAHSDKPDAENQGRGIPNYLGPVTISPDGSQAFVPSKQDNVLRGTQRDGQALNFQSTVRAVSSRVNLATQAEDLGSRIDHDNASVASAAAFDPLGVYLFVALETSREVAVIDAHRRNQILRIDVGRAPQALAVSADRRTLYVSNFMDRTVSVFDLAPLTQQGLAAVTPVATLTSTANEPLSATVLRGKQFFYDARDTRLARDRYMSCATCHNDGGHDGRTWDLSSQGEGLRNTASLRGRAGAMGRLHWSNNFDEVQDFEGQIRTLAGGTGLMTDAQYLTGTRSQPLGDRKTGVSADLDALAAYVASLTSFEPSPFRPSAGALSAAGAAGQQVFIAQNCASCHSGTAFTQSAVDNPANIGTIKPSSGQRLFGALTGIDVPTLRDVWATAPYLHDGSAPTLEAAVAAHVGVNLSATDLANVATYLREIGSEEPSAPLPATSGAGLVGRYYNGVALAGTPLLTRTEGVNFDWGTAVPGPGVPADNFSVRWTGTITIPSSGTYRFRTNSDDGVRLWVNGSQLINNWTDHGPTIDTSAGIYLFSGRRTVTLEYYERGGGATIQLQWLRPGTSTYVTIPVGNLNTN